MKPWKIFHNPRCSKSREALSLLAPHSPEVVEYLVTPPTEAELRVVLECLVGEPAELVRTREAGFLAQPFALDRATIARELSRRPELLERPVVVHGGRALVARPVHRLREWLGCAD